MEGPSRKLSLLIAGLDAHICDRCIIQAHGIVQEEAKVDDIEDVQIELKPPKEIKAFLDDLCYWSRIIQNEFSQ